MVNSGSVAMMHQKGSAPTGWDGQRILSPAVTLPRRGWYMPALKSVIPTSSTQKKASPMPSR